MRTMKMIWAGLLLMLPVLCQAQKDLFNTYNDVKGISFVYFVGNDRYESKFFYERYLYR